MGGHSRFHGRHHWRRFHNVLILVAVLICDVAIGADVRAFAQPADLACKYYDARCQHGLKSHLCAQLRQRCQSAVGKAAPEQSRAAGASHQPALNDLLTMPDCGPDEELVMVPACMCDTSADQGAAAAEASGCMSCSGNGVRLVCQKQR